MTRINKYLSERGVCSRREADRLVEAGHVSVNGKKAEPGTQVSDADEVLVNGKSVQPRSEKIYLKFYKPYGIVCTFEKRERDNLGDYLREKRGLTEHVTYAGRLDRRSEGLLLLTNDGDMIQEIMWAKNRHEKEYVVTTAENVTDDFLQKMAGGVYLEELQVRTRPCKAWKTGAREFHIILTQGLNRQIRRMCEACGNRVSGLKRIRVVNVLLGDLKPGEYRELTEAELDGLRRDIQA